MNELTKTEERDLYHMKDTPTEGVPPTEYTEQPMPSPPLADTGADAGTLLVLAIATVIVGIFLASLLR